MMRKSAHLPFGPAQPSYYAGPSRSRNEDAAAASADRRRLRQGCRRRRTAPRDHACGSAAVGDAIDAEHHGLAIERKVLLPHLACGLDDPRIAVSPVVSAPRDQAHAVAVALNLVDDETICQKLAGDWLTRRAGVRVPAGATGRPVFVRQPRKSSRSPRRTRRHLTRWLENKSSTVRFWSDGAQFLSSDQGQPVFVGG
jgi:hypothetical protein